jgi:hypothetical protein
LNEAKGDVEQFRILANDKKAFEDFREESRQVLEKKGVSNSLDWVNTDDVSLLIEHFNLDNTDSSNPDFFPPDEGCFLFLQNANFLDRKENKETKLYNQGEDRWADYTLGDEILDGYQLKEINNLLQDHSNVGKINFFNRNNDNKINTFNFLFHTAPRPKGFIEENNRRNGHYFAIQARKEKNKKIDFIIADSLNGNSTTNPIIDDIADFLKPIAPAAIENK